MTDANTGILPVEVPIDGSLIPGDPGVIIAVVSVDCTEALDDLEPDTATLYCDCAIDDVVFDNTEDCDAASFDCQTPGLSVDKACEDADQDGISAVTVEVRIETMANLLILLG